MTTPNPTPNIQASASLTPNPDPSTKPKKPRKKNDRHLFKPLPIYIEHQPHWSFHSFVHTLISFLYPYSIPQPYEGVLAADKSCVWVDQFGNHPRLSGLVKTTIPVGEGRHNLGLGLWRGGFFGKANFSRGEPTWWERIQGEGMGSESLAARRRAAQMAYRRQAATNAVTGDSGANDRPWIADAPEDLERYQLMPEEAFFLAMSSALRNYGALYAQAHNG
ncbi:hypothetical protein HK097_010536 [Rhizophlyctis rosea]|uniref:Uncharacterized protein n=1 Tax=Rhizophlyctis rosea TaxID=64517 RepID=A0AAD5WZQ1_9FUNG|nr:hypothetical protein HK097_010536 [Rhizophlyctis rosea]